MADKQEIFETIKQHLEGRGIEADKITREAELGKDLDLDSLDTMELTVQMEERFSIEIPDEELETLRTVDDAVELVAAKASVSA